MTSPRFAVSIKGVMAIDGRIPLLQNERDEWELPGGRLEAGEQPAVALARELAEELNIVARVDRIVDSWLYAIPGHGEVVIVTYGCTVVDASGLRYSAEHRSLQLVDPGALDGLNLPDGYRNSISAWLRSR